MPKKKSFFNKNNSKKYLLLPGSSGAQNADGEVLPTLLVPVSHAHKPGSSLLFSRIGAAEEASSNQKSSSEFAFAPPPISNTAGNETPLPSVGKELDLAKMLEDFADDETDEDDISDNETDEDDSCDDETDSESCDDYKNASASSESAFFKAQCRILNDPLSQSDRLKLKPSNHNAENFEDDGNESYYSTVSEQISEAEEFDNMYSEYALTSARQDCPELIKTFNERFEKMLEIYEDDQIGALDDEEICGHLNPDSEFVKRLVYSQDTPEECLEFGNYDDTLKEKILYLAEQDEVKYVEIETKAPLEFDCESILSTYSNIYNHPTVIKEESKIKKIKIPANPLKKGLLKSHVKQLNKECDSECSDQSEKDAESVVTCFNFRPKDETPEQRRERKSLFREAKRESRMLKKENKLAFKNEKKLHCAQLINLNRNRGIKLL